MLINPSECVWLSGAVSLQVASDLQLPSTRFVWWTSLIVIVFLGECGSQVRFVSTNCISEFVHIRAKHPDGESRSSSCWGKARFHLSWKEMTGLLKRKKGLLGQITGKVEAKKHKSLQAQMQWRSGYLVKRKITGGYIRHVTSILQRQRISNPLFTKIIAGRAMLETGKYFLTIRPRKQG